MNIDFHPSLKQSILSKKKTATIRYGWRDGVNDPRDYTRNDGTGMAVFPDGSSIPLIIETVEFVNYIWEEENITANTLKRENVHPANEDGFYGLLKALQNYYPNMDIGSNITIVYFHLKK